MYRTRSLNTATHWTHYNMRSILRHCHHSFNFCSSSPTSVTCIPPTSIAQPTTGPTAPCKTPACLTTHLGTSSGVQIVVIDQKLNHFSMAFSSCQVQHGELVVVSAVEQRLHLRCKVLNSADTAIPCSPVESIPSLLKQGNTKEHVRTSSM